LTIISSCLLVGCEAVAEVDIVPNGELILFSGISIAKNGNLILDTDDFARVGCSRSEGSKCGEKNLSHLNFF
jgi:hypothetical protein